MKIVACGLVADGVELQELSGNDGIVLWAEVNRLGEMNG